MSEEETKKDKSGIYKILGVLEEFKKLIGIVMFFIVGGISLFYYFCVPIYLTGTITDFDTGQPIDSVLIECYSCELSVYSKPDGYFKTQVTKSLIERDVTLTLTQKNYYKKEQIETVGYKTVKIKRLEMLHKQVEKTLEETEKDEGKDASFKENTQTADAEPTKDKGTGTVDTTMVSTLALEVEESIKSTPERTHSFPYQEYLRELGQLDVKNLIVEKRTHRRGGKTRIMRLKYSLIYASGDTVKYAINPNVESVFDDELSSEIDQLIKQDLKEKFE